MTCGMLQTTAGNGLWQTLKYGKRQGQAQPNPGTKVWQAHRYGKQRVMVGKTVWELPRCGRKCGMAYGKARQAAGYDGQSVNVGAVAWRAAAYGKQYRMASRNVWRVAHYGRSVVWVLQAARYGRQQTCTTCTHAGNATLCCPGLILSWTHSQLQCNHPRLSGHAQSATGACMATNTLAWVAQ